MRQRPIVPPCIKEFDRRARPIDAELKQVTLTAPDKLVLDNVSLQVRRGEILRLGGASGAGKSVIMRMLLGLEQPTAGMIELFGRDTAKMRESARLKAIATRVGVVFQTPKLMTNFSGAENIFEPHRQRGHRFSAPEMRRSATIIGRLGLTTQELDRQASLLSVGQQQRISFASALAHRPDMLLLDEPTSAQDPEKRATMFHMLRTVVSDPDHPCSAVLITHDAIPDGIVDREVFVDQGRAFLLRQPTASGNPYWFPHS